MGWVAEGLEQYRGLRTPPIFWPMLLQIQGEASGLAGRPADGLPAVDEAIKLAPFLPDPHLVRGDLLRLLGEDAEAIGSFGHALQAARRWGATMPELRAARRLYEVDGPRSPSRQDERLAMLAQIFDTFSEGLETPEIVAVRDLLEANRYAAATAAPMPTYVSITRLAARAVMYSPPSMALTASA